MCKHTKARKPLLKLNLRKPCLQPQKGFSFEVFSLLQRDKLWESFPRQSGRLPTRKQQTVLFLLHVKELNMALWGRLIIWASASWFVHNFSVWSNYFFFLLDVSRTWSISQCRKNWRYLTRCLKYTPPRLWIIKQNKLSRCVGKKYLSLSPFNIYTLYVFCGCRWD